MASANSWGDITQILKVKSALPSVASCTNKRLAKPESVLGYLYIITPP